MKILKFITTIFLVALMAASVTLLYNCTDTDSPQGGGRIEEAPPQQSGGSILDNEIENSPEFPNSTEPGNSTESSDPTDPTEPAEPSDPTEPTEPTEPSDPTEPTEPTEPSDPTEPTEPAEPSDPTEPDKPTEPTEPTEPEKPKKELTNPAPNFTVLDYEGNQVKLSDYIGKPIVLNFWATWCGYCKLEMPDFERARLENPDVLFLMVNATDGEYETVELAKAYIEENGYGFEVVFDTMDQAQSAYGISAYPTTYFIDEVGNLVAYARGAISYNTLMDGIGRIK